jgi:hypothetical protein
MRNEAIIVSQVKDDTQYEPTIRALSWKICAGVLFFYVSCIYLFPRIPGIPLRVEDILFPLFMVIAVFSFDGLSKKNTLPLLLYCIYVFVGSLIGVLNQKIDIRGVSVALKEIQYVTGFFLLYSCCNKTELEASKTLQVLSWLLWVPALFGLVMMITNQVGYYGISALNEKSPSLSGQMYFSGFVLAFILFKFFHLKQYVALSILLCIGTFMVGSRTAIAMLVLFLFFMNVRFNWKFVRFVFIAIGVLYLSSVAIEFYLEHFYDDASVLGRSLRRANSLFQFVDNLAPRVDAWITHRFHTPIDSWSVLFGYGRGYENMNPDGTWRGFELNVDSQYIRDFFEIGLLGMTMKLSAIIIIITSMRGVYLNIFVAYVIAYSAAGVTMELFNLSKPGALFWLVAALCLVCSKFDLNINDRVK